MQIWKVKLGHNVKFLFRLIEHKVSRFGQDFEDEVQARTLKLRFRQDFEVEVWSLFYY